MRVLSGVVIALVACAHVQGGRVKVPFGNGWRFHLGDDPTGPSLGPNDCEFTEIDNHTCTDMEYNDFRFLPQDCMMACCYNPDCYAWQQLHDICRHGTNVTTCVKGGDGMVGGFRAISPPFYRGYNFSDMNMNDSGWDVVAVPHDFSINQTFSDDGDRWHAYLPRNTSWYRKHFTLPLDLMNGNKAYLVFEGVREYVEVYINGVWVMDHAQGYTEFVVPLNDLVKPFPAVNVIALRVDATYGSGHWYEGGGVYRSVDLLFVNATAHFAHHGVFVNPESDGTEVHVTVEVETDQPHDINIPLTFSLDALDNSFHASVQAGVCTASSGSRGVFNYTWQFKPGELTKWSLQNPNTYIFRAMLGNNTSEHVDEVQVTTAFRTTSWGTNFALNGQPVALRGFSHHATFAGAGAVGSARLYLFRVQIGKAVGANFWRCSHNPYEQHLYEVLTATGMLNWDENRDYAYENRGDFADLIRMHRNHPAIVLWSFCNELSCNKDDAITPSSAFAAIAKALDPDRATTANQIPPGTIPVSALDVVAFSHGQNTSFQTENKDYPEVPLLLGECCVCSEHRMDARNYTDCMREQNYPGTVLPFVAGSTGVWTLLDYYGESNTWPQITSPKGQFDISGFPKSHAWWYRTYWLANIPLLDPSRPAIKDIGAVARVLNVWDSLLETQISCAVSTVAAELFIDGITQGIVSPNVDGLAAWPAPRANASNITCTAITLENDPVASHTLMKPSEGKTLQLVVDVPSETTGTGQKLYLDGKDMALLRAQVVDAHGVVNSTIAGTVRFSVSGPARLVGTASSPNSHYQVQGSTQEFYGGLIRAVVMVTLDCTTNGRNVTFAVDVDQHPLTYMKICPSPSPLITVTAVSDLFGTATATIMTSYDPSDNPIAVARANANLSTFTYMDDIVS
ncbi:hypothetical protein DIPPA_51424 [Diplonema papillatum]|nr:hypothetical protein DIPPA_51424 [Diplonema papillatum]